MASSSAVNGWPIVISDAPIRCGQCDEKIIGSGTGVLSVLRRAVERHIDVCPSRRTATTSKGDGDGASV